MALPKGWEETANEWRVRLRAPGRFTRIRPKPLEGVQGVYMVGGPLKASDRERARHARGAFVPQALRFKKTDWPSLTAAVGWFQASRFAGEQPNPPATELHLRDRAARSLDLTHMVGERGPKTFQARNRLAKWLDETSTYSVARPYRGALADIRHLEELSGGRANPPAKGSSLLEAYRVNALAAIARLVTTETELQSLFVQALEMIDRGAPIPEWIRTRARGLQLEKMARLEQVKTAVERHGAALGEFDVPKAPRRKNPAGQGRAAAVDLYRQFHGVAPKSFHTETIPDLTQLVHLGCALRIDYQAARPRGPRGTPYRHAFAPGSELFTDRTGRALVILGNLKVSRAPRGRFGYIRAGARA